MKKKISLILAVLMLLALCTACGEDSGEEVTVESVADICGMGATGLADRFAGIVSPQGETKIKRSDTGIIGEIFVSVGDTVSEGQVLFTYDTQQISMDIERASLELEQMTNTVSSKRDEKAALEAEKATVSEELQLSYSLEIRDIEASIQEMGYSITLKSKEIDRLKESLASSEVRSPASGRVQSINENGGYDDMGNELPFMSIVETDGYRIKGYVNEVNAYAMSDSTPVIVRSRVSDELWRGYISMIDWNDPQQNQNYYGDDETAMSSKYPFYVELDSSDGLMLGQHVYIEPDYGQETEPDADAIMLPSYYIVDADSSPFVWAQNGRGKLEKRSLTLSEYMPDTDCYEVLEGLSAEDFIAFPDETLSEGMTCIDYVSSASEDVYPEDDIGIVSNGFDGAMPVPEVEYAS